MRVIIPVAGQGTRVRPLTYSISKVLLPVGGRRAIDFILDELAPLAPSEIIFIINHNGDDIRQYATRHCRFPVRFVTQGDAWGLGHAVHLAGAHVPRGEPVLIALGDTVFAADMARMRECEGNTIGVNPVDDPRRFGVIETNSEGRIVRFYEKPADPPSNLAIVGIYLIRDSVRLFDCLDRLVSEFKEHSREEIQLTDALQAMLDQGSVFSPFPIDDWFDCGKFDTILETNRRLLTRKSIQHEFVGEDVTILPPVAFEPGCRLRNCVIGPHVSLGHDCRIEDAEVTNSIIGDGVTLRGVSLYDSFIGNNARILGAGGLRMHMLIGSDSLLEL